MKDKADSVSDAPDRLLCFSVVGRADVERIHELSLRVLAETGPFAPEDAADRRRSSRIWPGLRF
jgi:hypothetical protein